jgi:uncharacterized lipoprotein YmbA
MRALLLAIAALGLAACSEDTQVVQYEQGKYQGKADTRAWDNDGTWTKGDRGSWERGIKVRQLTQNEYGRMYGK